MICSTNFAIDQAHQNHNLRRLSLCAAECYQSNRVRKFIFIHNSAFVYLANESSGSGTMSRSTGSNSIVHCPSKVVDVTSFFCLVAVPRRQRKSAAAALSAAQTPVLTGVPLLLLIVHRQTGRLASNATFEHTVDTHLFLPPPRKGMEESYFGCR